MRRSAGVAAELDARHESIIMDATPRMTGRLMSLIVGLACGVVALPCAAQERVETWVNGITESINDVVLGASLAGIVGRRPVGEGDSVAKGDIILELDQSLEVLEVERRAKIMELRETDLNSLKKLVERSAISVSREEVMKAQTEYSVAAVEFKIAEEQLRKRRIIAPFEGVIAELVPDVGEAVQAQQPVVRLVDSRRCFFICNLEADRAHHLVEGEPATLQLPSGTELVTVLGEVAFVSPVVDPASGLMKVKVAFENADGRIRPGVSGRMRVREN